MPRGHLRERGAGGGGGAGGCISDLKERRLKQIFHGKCRHVYLLLELPAFC